MNNIPISKISENKKPLEKRSSLKKLAETFFEKESKLESKSEYQQIVNSHQLLNNFTKIIETR